jgi:hypothetical protein
MSKRIIIARFEIDDNDVIEQKLFDSLQCEALKDFQKLPDTSELYENDSNFRELAMKLKAAKRYYNDYINKNLIK